MTDKAHDSPRFPPDIHVRRNEDAATSDLGDEVVVLEPEEGRYFGLQEVGALVWKILEDGSTVAEIEAAILKEYGVSKERCHEDLQELLTELSSRGLIRTGPV